MKKMFSLVLICLFVLLLSQESWRGKGVAFAASDACSSELFISEYVEGSSNNKALEIYNGTGATVDLSTYAVFISFNGGSTSRTVGLSGSLASGDVFVLADDDADAAILAVADQTDTGSFWNGDDAIALQRNGLNVDVIGQIGTDPGSEWGTGDASTQNNTLRRKSGFVSGDRDGADAFDPAGEWSGFAQDTFGGLGSHTVDPCNLWLAFESNNWDNDDDWSTGFHPDSTSNVVVPASAGGDVALTANAFARDVIVENGRTLTTAGSDLTIGRNLFIESGGVVNVTGGSTLTVNGTIVNNGTLEETKTVSGASDVTFLSAGGYGGLVINAAGNGDLGATQVTIRAGQACNSTDDMVHRCFDISPTITSGLGATVTFFYSEAELNGNSCSGMQAHHWNGGSWDQTYSAFSTDCASDPHSLTVNNVSDFSPFGLSSSSPTALTLTRLRVERGLPLGVLFLSLLVTLTLVGFVFWRRRKDLTSGV